MLAARALAAMALAAAMVVGWALAAGGPIATATAPAAPSAPARDSAAAGGQQTDSAAADPWAMVLGIAQDGGYPQAGTKESPAWADPALRRLVASLGVVDPADGGRWLVDATPDFPAQLHRLDVVAPVTGTPGLPGLLLT